MNTTRTYPQRPSPASEGLTRVVIHTGNQLLPEIAHGGWTTTSRALRNNLPAHRHNEAYEFCYLVAGEAHWWARNQVFQLSPHHVFMTLPDETHGGVDDMLHPCEIYWFQCRLRRDGDLGFSALEIRRLQGALKTLPTRVAAAGPDLLALFQQLLDEHRRPGQEATLRARALGQLMVLDLLTAFQRAAAKKDAQPASYSKPVERAVAALAQGIGGPPPLDAACRASGLKPTQFRLRFKRETGFTPQEFFLRLRLRQAQQWLREGTPSVTAIAHRLGFSSSQHFAGFFKQRTGLSPSQYAVSTNQRPSLS